jgi:long-chain fatty acid transport protein
MRHPRRFVPLCLLASLACAQHLSASGFGLFQHGGRGMGQAGAFTARAPEPSAVTYNPAAITRLDGLQTQAGLDFNNAKDKYESATGTFEADHIIQFPPSFYATWKPQSGPFALGLGLDASFYYNLNWDPALFPGRLITRRFELRVYELHPVLAYDLGDGWSVGGGFRYVKGSLDQDDNARLLFSASPPGTIPQPFLIEVERNASSDVDAFAWDLAIDYAAPAWGWGAVYRSAAKLKGSGDASYRPRDVPVGVPGLDEAIRARLVNGGSRQSFELPREVRVGVWYAPYPELRLELDAAYQSWSSLEATDVSYDPNVFGDGPTVRTPRDWKNTTSLRLGLEGDITDNFMIYGGVAQEPSPVPASTLEPGFTRGDAMVYAAGFSYSFPRLSLDLGYSLHEHDDRGVNNQEPLNPGRAGTYSASDQVWGFSARWRL